MKARIEFEMPEMCSLCPLCHFDGEETLSCRAVLDHTSEFIWYEKKIGDYCENIKPTWCPLVEVKE